jgi:hypothetical protein
MKYAAIATALALVMLGGHAVAGDSSATTPLQATSLQATSLQATPLQATRLQAPAEQKQEAHAEIIVLHATSSGKGIDKKIADKERKALKKPPFSAYDSYELLEEEGIFFSKGKPAELELPNKGKLKLELNGLGEKADLAITITKPNKKKFVAANVKAKVGKTFFVAGPRYKDGILVLGIRVKPKADPPKKK